MKNILNIAGYKFVSLENLTEMRQHLKVVCATNELKGTILLAPEGINIMLAGLQEAIKNLIGWLSEDKKFADIEFKKSYSESVPFKRLLIKIRKEIITFSIPNINPEKFPAPKITPQQLKQWLDQNKDVVILDARNLCEIEVGKFNGAMDLGINNFRNFPQAAKKISPELKPKPIVTYCTGGIRCEKAATYLMQLGFEQVYQLTGGILKYFEECGGSHYQGKCFVFDERVALDENMEYSLDPDQSSA